MKKFVSIFLCTLAIILLASCQENTQQKTVGKFYSDVNLLSEETYYQFRSDDDSVWWILSAEEIGFVPKEGTEYVLVYDNSGTTAENKPCECGPEFDCECEVYDDIFIKVYERK